MLLTLCVMWTESLSFASARLLTWQRPSVPSGNERTKVLPMFSPLLCGIVWHHDRSRLIVAETESRMADGEEWACLGIPGVVSRSPTEI